ncbi:hypothetical protein BDB00DRAFT_275629 [Zychaea mexicana]|uniref:uncharacterized protein n=1 Tax=Zychaea mexicana TaxID=64656 RepID=UPI0022FED333|nr:uncharacterized protein BDB00DRAFT_275629 [Zychaea mexicana]KAI9494855.1 hypothetical protein BDB00DRAFT_275629 [Zychaea mexicana]
MFSAPRNLPKTLTLEPYIDQQAHGLPDKGRHIIGQFDDDSIVVYQAYSPSIATYAVEHQRFGSSSFSFDRMSWIKTSFAWMQYRCGWNTKPRQERTLAIRIKRDAFDSIVADAVGSRFIEEVHGTKENYEKIKKASEVRRQWDPDYKPNLEFTRMERRAIQLGLRGNTLRRYATEWIVSIEDITPYVEEMRTRLQQAHNPVAIWVPVERVYKEENKW